MAEMPDLSGKLYYTISEVSELTGVKPHVLRYWESEFSTLKPRKDRGGSRRYRRRDIEEVLAIKTLLYEEGYRIAGARKTLQQRRQSPEKASDAPRQLAMTFDQLDQQQQLTVIRQELTAIQELLRELAPARKARKAQN